MNSKQTETEVRSMNKQPQMAGRKRKINGGVLKRLMGMLFHY